MKRLTLVVGLALTAGLVVGVIGNQAISFQHGSKHRDLIKRDLSGKGLDGKEVRLWEAIIAPGESTGKHCHPGYEFTYILQGLLLYDAESGYETGQPSVTLKPGDVVYLPPGKIHNGINQGKTPVKVLMFSIDEKDKPRRIPQPGTPVDPSGKIPGC